MDILIIFSLLVFLILQDVYFSNKKTAYSKKIWFLDRPFCRIVQLQNGFENKLDRKKFKFNTLFFLVISIVLYILGNINQYDFSVEIGMCLCLSITMFAGFLTCKIVRHFKNKNIKAARKKFHEYN